MGWGIEEAAAAESLLFSRFNAGNFKNSNDCGCNDGAGRACAQDGAAATRGGGGTFRWGMSNGNDTEGEESIPSSDSSMIQLFCCFRAGGAASNGADTAGGV